MQEVGDVVAVEVGHHERHARAGGLRRPQLHEEAWNDERRHARRAQRAERDEKVKDLGSPAELDDGLRHREPVGQDEVGRLRDGVRARAREESRADRDEVLDERVARVPVELALHERLGGVPLVGARVDGLEVERLVLCGPTLRGRRRAVRDVTRQDVEPAGVVRRALREQGLAHRRVGRRIRARVALLRLPRHRCEEVRCDRLMRHAIDARSTKTGRRPRASFRPNLRDPR